MQAASARELLAREVTLLEETQAQAIRRLLHDLNLLPAQTEKVIPARDACRAANRWLLMYVGNLLSAGEAAFIPGPRPAWQIPVRTHFEHSGVASFVTVDALSGEVIADETTAESVLRAVQRFVANGTSDSMPGRGTTKNENGRTHLEIRSHTIDRIARAIAFRPAHRWRSNGSASDEHKQSLAFCLGLFQAREQARSIPPGWNGWAFQWHCRIPSTRMNYGPQSSGKTRSSLFLSVLVIGPLTEKTCLTP